MGFTLLMVDDTADDHVLARYALEYLGGGMTLQTVRDGQEAIDYVSGRPPFEDRRKYPFPDGMLLDLKMPRMSGFDVLEWLRENPQHRVVPTMVFSSSYIKSDVTAAYQLGAHGFFAKPPGFEDLVRIFRAMEGYWTLCQRPEPGSLAPLPPKWFQTSP